MDSVHTHEWRFYVYARCKLGAKPSQIHKDLTTVLEDKCPSYRTIYRWILSFNKGKGSTKDNPRSGRPSTAMTEENISSVRRMVTEDPFITIFSISKSLGVSRGSVHTILHHTLNMTNDRGWWVPYSSQKRGPRKKKEENITDQGQESSQMLQQQQQQQQPVVAQPFDVQQPPPPVSQDFGGYGGGNSHLLHPQHQLPHQSIHHMQSHTSMGDQRGSMEGQRGSMGDLLQEDLPHPPYPPEPELISRVDCVIKEDSNDTNGHFLAEL